MAQIKYYDYINGKYVEDMDGPLVGIEWQDANQNDVRAILFLMDFSILQYGHEIPFIYQTEVRAYGTDEWLLQTRKEFKITNDVLIVPDDHPNVLSAFRIRANDAPPEPEAVGQMDYFVDVYLKGGKYPPGLLVPMYEWLAEIIAELEGQTLDAAYEFLPLTLQVVATLESMGIHLSRQQQIDLDIHLRENPQPAGVPAGAKAAYGLPPTALNFVRKLGYRI